MDNFQKLRQIALDNNVSFEELCIHAPGTGSGEGEKRLSEKGCLSG
jgi:hypothetical protein